MDQGHFDSILKDHDSYLRGRMTCGHRAIFQGVTLNGIDFSLRPMTGVWFTRVRFVDCFASGKANFSNTTLREVDFRDVRGLEKAQFHRADINDCSFRRCNLVGADFSYARTYNTDFTDTDLMNANLEYTTLTGARLLGVNLSGATGLLSARDFMRQFEQNNNGWIVYKVIGGTDYMPPSRWKIEEGSVLTETANPDRSTPCGCGVNFADRLWCNTTYSLEKRRGRRLWKCLIRWEDGPGIVVPYDTDGKARCERLVLIKREA